MTIDTSMQRTFDRLVQAQSANFAQVMDDTGQTVKSASAGGLKGRLVALVEGGAISKGSIADRVIRRLVGGENFDRIATEMRQNKETSIGNVLKLVVKDLNLDDQLQNEVTALAKQKLSAGRITLGKCADVGQEIMMTVSQRRADRMEIADRVLGEGENWMMTPAMAVGRGEQAEVSGDEALVAYKALTEGVSVGQAFQEVKKQPTIEHRTPERTSVIRERAELLVAEMKEVEQYLRNPPELRAKLSESATISASSAVATPDLATEQAGQHNKLEEEITLLKEQSNERADNFKQRYTMMLAALYDHDSVAKGGRYFPLPEVNSGDTVTHAPPLFEPDGKGGSVVKDGSAFTFFDENVFTSGNKPSNLRKGDKQTPQAPGRAVSFDHETPVQVKTHELKQTDETHEQDVEAGDLKSYNSKLFAEKSKLNLEGVAEYLEATDVRDMSRSDEKMMIDGFFLVTLPLKNPRYYNEAQVDTAKGLAAHPALQASRVVDYIGNQVYRPPVAPVAVAGELPQRSALRGALFDRSIGNLKFIADDAEVEMNTRQRAATLLQTVCQDLLDNADIHPTSRSSIDSANSRLAYLNSAWPALSGATRDIHTISFEAGMQGRMSALNTAKHNFDTYILDSQDKTHTTENVADALRSGDKSGIRSLSTLLKTFHLPANNLAGDPYNPAQLTAETLNGDVEDWEEQTIKFTTLSRKIADACFNENLPAAFTQYGTTGHELETGNAFNRLEKQFPQHDHAVRKWIKQGIDLTERLVVAQAGAGKGAAPLTPGEMADLEQAVEQFNDAEARA